MITHRIQLVRVIGIVATYIWTHIQQVVVVHPHHRPTLSAIHVGANNRGDENGRERPESGAAFHRFMFPRLLILPHVLPVHHLLLCIMAKTVVDRTFGDPPT